MHSGPRCLAHLEECTGSAARRFCLVGLRHRLARKYIRRLPIGVKDSLSSQVNESDEGPTDQQSHMLQPGKSSQRPATRLRLCFRWHYRQSRNHLSGGSPSWAHRLSPAEPEQLVAERLHLTAPFGLGAVSDVGERPERPVDRIERAKFSHQESVCIESAKTAWT